MPTIKIKVDLECSRCRAKIEKVLTRIQEKGEFCIDKIDYDEKNNKVIVSGPFDAEKLAEKLCCKACKIIKEIEIVEPQPPPQPEKIDPPPVVVVEPPVVVVEPPVVVVEQPTKEKDEQPPPVAEKEDPPQTKQPPPLKNVEVPYPFPYPYPFPAWPQQCCWKPCPCYDQHGHGGCRCCSCGRAYEEPAPQPAPQPVPYVPPAPWPCNGYKIVCEEDPSYACSIM